MPTGFAKMDQAVVAQVTTGCVVKLNRNFAVDQNSVAKVMSYVVALSVVGVASSAVKTRVVRLTLPVVVASVVPGALFAPQIRNVYQTHVLGVWEEGSLTCGHFRHSLKAMIQYCPTTS